VYIYTRKCAKDRLSIIDYVHLHFTQDEVENQVTAVEDLMELVLTLMLESHSGRSSDNPKSRGLGDSAHPSKMEPITIGVADERTMAAGMRAIVAYIRLW
jgi:hypothetical protein